VTKTHGADEWTIITRYKQIGTSQATVDVRSISFCIGTVLDNASFTVCGTAALHGSLSLLRIRAILDHASFAVCCTAALHGSLSLFCIGPILDNASFTVCGTAALRRSLSFLGIGAVLDDTGFAISGAATFYRSFPNCNCDALACSTTLQSMIIVLTFGSSRKRNC
jgi:hypothetical protein